MQSNQRLTAQQPAEKLRISQVFYAACQALLYILCYRLDHLMAASQPAHGLESTSPTGVLDGAAVHAQLRQLFADTMPQVLNHRWAPCSCTGPFDMWDAWILHKYTCNPVAAVVCPSSLP